MNINSSSKIGINTKFGFNFIVEENVEIGNDCVIGHNVIILKNTVVGDNVRIDDNTIIGKIPLFSPRSIFKKQKEYNKTYIGDNCQIGANVIIYIQAVVGKSNLIADLTTIRENVKIGDFNIIGRGVAIENFCNIGNKNKLETNVYITAYSDIEDYCFIAPGVITSNDNYMARDKERFDHFKGITVKTGGRIGANVTILPGKKINFDGTVAAGSVVTKDIPKEEIWMGNPGKKYKNVAEKQLLRNNMD